MADKPREKASALGDKNMQSQENIKIPDAFENLFFVCEALSPN